MKIEGIEDTIMGLPIDKIKEYLKIMNNYFVIGSPVDHSLSFTINSVIIGLRNIKLMEHMKKENSKETN